MRKSIAALILILAMVIPAVSASAADDDIRIRVLFEGVEQAFTDVNGDPVPIFLLEGTTYLPLRAVAGLAWCSVDWIESSDAINLLPWRDTNVTYPGASGVTLTTLDQPITKAPTLLLLGTEQQLTDVNGTPVYPFIYKGTTYLPLRAVCGLVEMPVRWDGDTNTIYLGVENAPIPDIPEGVHVLTWDDIAKKTDILRDTTKPIDTDQQKYYYEDGKFVQYNNVQTSNPTALYFLTNGYTRLTFTVHIVGGRGHNVDVNLHLDAEEKCDTIVTLRGKYPEGYKWVEKPPLPVGSVVTYTVDVSEYEMAAVIASRGLYQNVEIFGAYFHNGEPGTPPLSVPDAIWDATYYY